MTAIVRETSLKPLLYSFPYVMAGEDYVFSARQHFDSELVVDHEGLTEALTYNAPSLKTLDFVDLASSIDECWLLWYRHTYYRKVLDVSINRLPSNPLTRPLLPQSWQQCLRFVLSGF